MPGKAYNWSILRQMTIRFWLLFFLLVPVVSSGQIVDDFSDGNFISMPAWSGMDSHFVVNTSQELQLLASPITSESFLSTSNLLMDSIEWKFRCRMDFNPSSSNRALVYLVSDSADLRSALNGYFVMIGNSADEISLYRQQGSGTPSKIIDGADSTAFANSVDVKVRVRRDVLGNWTLEHDVNGSGTWTLEGQVFDTIVKSTSYFGVLCDYTSTRSDKFFFDDFYVGYPISDTTAPNLLSIGFPDSNQLLLGFDESLDLSSAQNPASYNLSSGQALVNTASLQSNTSEVLLQFNSALNVGLQDTLEIQNVMDTAGNALGLIRRAFQFVYVDSAQAKDVLINEFMADPTPPVALPEHEFIELYNASSKNFDLSAWTIGDASNDVPLPSHQLLSGDYLILCSPTDSLEFAPFGDVLPVAGMPALNNSGDDIRLQDSYGNVIDELTYDLSWYKDDQKDDGGFSLEKINPNQPCDGEKNWIASASLDGGSPGQQNSVYSTKLDSTAPSVTDFKILGEQLFEVGIDEPASFDSLHLSWQWSVPPAGSSGDLDIDTVVWMSDTRFMIQTSNSYKAGSILLLNIFGIEDCIGNRDSISATAVLGATPSLFDILITEIMAKPDELLSSMPDAEYIEIFNSSLSYVEVGGLILSDKSSSAELDSFVIAPNGQLVLCSPSNTSLFLGVDVLGVSSFPSLNDLGDDLSLRTADAVLLHRIDYESSWHTESIYKDGGYSLEMTNYMYPCGGQENWSTSQEDAGGSPGRRNQSWDFYRKPDFARVTSAVGIDENTVSCNLSKDIFYEELIPPQVQNWTITSSDLQIDSFKLENPKNLVLSLGEPMQKGQVYNVEIENFMMCLTKGIAGTHSHSFTFALAEEAGENDVVVNEILFNPLYDGGSDYIEIINRSEKMINLKNWSFSNVDLDEDTLEMFGLLGSENMLLEPGEILCFSENSTDLLDNYPEAIASQLVEVTDLLSYNNGEGVVVLIDAQGKVIDSVYYKENYHSPLLRDYDGKSLERINPYGGSLDPSNWQTAGQNVGYGTPGKQNSQFIETGKASSGLVIGTSIFSPDGDGYQDVLNIEYAFQESGLYANLWILDRRGQLVRRLANNELLSLEGNYFWNGLDDEGHKMGLGLYVIYLEVFDSQGSVRVYKEPISLAGKL